MTELMTQQQVSELLSISVGSLANWRSDGKGPRYVKIGGRIKYRPADVEKFIDGSVRQSTSAA